MISVIKEMNCKCVAMAKNLTEMKSANQEIIFVCQEMICVGLEMNFIYPEMIRGFQENDYDS